MVPVNLFDALEIETTPQHQIALSCQGLEVATGEKNLVYQAARDFLDRSGGRFGLSIKLFKKIPVAAGLGGGSSDAASTLLLLNEICSRPFTYEELHRMARRLGADVPFFIDCRPSLAGGIGEVLTPLQRWPSLWYLLITPHVQVSTAWVYGQVKLKLTTGEHDSILNALSQEKIAISHILENDLEEVTSAAFPIIKTIKSALMDAGAEGALMSGSGPSVFGVFLSQERALWARRSLKRMDFGDIFLVTDWKRGRR
jgi:4-diphosphocytidyl-2-C-methyl-D-erythritol kinase